MFNPFSTTAKLVKTEKMANEIQKEINGMTKSNWKTNLMGIITLVMGLASLWAPTQYQGKIQQTSALFAGAGLLAAKDHNN